MMVGLGTSCGPRDVFINRACPPAPGVRGEGEAGCTTTEANWAWGRGSLVALTVEVDSTEDCGSNLSGFRETFCSLFEEGTVGGGSEVTVGRGLVVLCRPLRLL